MTQSNIKYLNRFYLTLFVLATFVSTGAHAQKIEGIYISEHDLTVNKLSFQNKDEKKYKIKLHDFVYKTYITVTCNDSVFTLLKDSIYGYKTTSDEAFRFFNKTVYPIVNLGEQILLYKKTHTTGQSKNPKTITTYYFSANAASQILPLTIKNLIAAFAGNKKFTAFIELHFHNDAELIEFDNANKMYKINRLLQLSLQN